MLYPVTQRLRPDRLPLLNSRRRPEHDGVMARVLLFVVAWICLLSGVGTGILLFTIFQTTRPVFEDDRGQFIIEDGERVDGVWLLPADEAVSVGRKRRHVSGASESG